MLPLRRSSPNPKKRLGEEEKPTRTNMIAQISTTISTRDTRIYSEVRQPHKWVPMSSLLRWPQRSESLPPPCLSQGQRSLELSTKKSRVIQTSQGSFTRWKLWATPSQLGFQEAKSNRRKSNRLDEEIEWSSLPKWVSHSIHSPFTHNPRGIKD